MEARKGLILALVAVFMLSILAGCAAPAPTPTATAKAAAATPKPAAPTPTKALPKVTLKYAYSEPPAMEISKSRESLAKRISELTNGTVTVETFGGASLVKELETIEAVRSGTVDMASIQYHRWVELIPAGNFGEVPFLFNDTDHLAKALQAGIADLMHAEMAKKGVMALGSEFYFPVNTIDAIKKPIKKPEDLKGLKIRAPSPLASKMVEAFGAASVVMAAGDVYLALERGVFDGVITSFPGGLVGYKWYEKIPYVTVLPFSELSGSLMINPKSWEKLAPEQQEAIKKAVAEHSPKTLQDAKTGWRNDMEFVKQKGLEVYIVPPAELGAWREPIKSVWDEYLSKAGDLGKRIIEIADKTRSQ